MLKTLPYHPGVIKDDTDLDAQGYATDSEKIRWVNGKVQALGGWTTTLSGIRGVARAIHEFANLEGRAFAAIGTTKSLLVYDGERFVDITPLRSSGTAGSDPVSTTDGSTTVEITISSHGAITGDRVYLRNDTATGGVTLGGQNGTLSSNPFTTTTGSRRVRVDHTAHGLQDNDIVHFSSATAVGGVPAGELNTANGLRVIVASVDLYYIEVETEASTTATGGGTPDYEYAKPYDVTVVDASTISVEVSSAASATTTGGGAGVGYQFDISIGEQSVTTSSGGAGAWGAGLYGAGLYGFGDTTAGDTESAVDTPARLWSLDNWGEQIIANIIGGAIYHWDGNRSNRATTLSGAPGKANCIIVTPERFLLALGCNDGSGDFDPLLARFPSGTDITDWTPSATNSAGDFRLGEGTQVVGVVMGRTSVLVFTDRALYGLRYVGDFDQVYAYDLLGTACGLLAPNAVTRFAENDVYWLSTSWQPFVYAGGAPRPVPCPLRRWLEDGANRRQRTKLFASYDARYPAVQWHFQSSDGDDVDTYIRLDTAEQQRDPMAGWSHGTMARTCWTTGELFNRAPLAISVDGTLYEHDLAFGDDGADLTGFVRWAPAEIDDGDKLSYISRFVIDGEYADKPKVTLYGRHEPNSSEFSKGPITLNGKGYIDRRIKARQVGLKISFDSSSFWRIGVIKADVSSSSRR